MASADFQEMQGMLGKITDMPQEGPEKPSWFSSASSPEWQQYNNYYEMQKMIQRASLLQELDQRLNPISLGESARFLGKQPGEIAAPGQMRDVTHDEMARNTMAAWVKQGKYLLVHYSEVANVT